MNEITLTENEVMPYFTSTIDFFNKLLVILKQKKQKLMCCDCGHNYDNFYEIGLCGKCNKERNIYDTSHCSECGYDEVFRLCPKCKSDNYYWLEYFIMDIEKYLKIGKYPFERFTLNFKTKKSIINFYLNIIK